MDLIAAKQGASEVFNRVIAGMTDANGVHLESLLVAFGSLAGYSCQAALRAQALAQGMPETSAFFVVTTSDGNQYFFGEPLNTLLAGPNYSVWGLVAGAAQSAGVKDLPDLNEIFHYTSSVLGSERFGTPRIPEGRGAVDTPINYLKALWPALFPTVKSCCPDPVDWVVLYGLAAQHAIDYSVKAIDASLACRIVMESAISMSKVDLAQNA